MKNLKLNKKSVTLLIVCLVITSMFVSGCSLSSKSLIKGMELTNVSQSSWMWNATDVGLISVISQIKMLKLDTVYINTGWSPEKNKFYLENHPIMYATFIRTASSYKISVEALLSNCDWALEENYTDFEKQVKTILDYNKIYKDGFDAIHLDIEPYILPGWDNNIESYLSSYIDNLEKIKLTIGGHNLRNKDNIKLSLDIPFWFSQEQFNVKGENVIDLMLNIADELVIMNYTQIQSDFVERGIEVLKIADKHPNKSVKMAIEFQADYSDVGVWDMTPDQIINYLDNSIPEFNKYESFKGLAIHDYTSYIKYISQKTE